MQLWSRNNMPCAIRDPETERLAHALAAATGKPLTRAIRDALRDALRRATRSARPSIAAKVRRVQARVAALPVLDPRPAAELIQFDAKGVPV
jgi:hypothetical protein